MRRYRRFNKICKTIKITPMISKPRSTGVTSLTNMREKSIHKNQQLLNFPNNIKNIQAIAHFLHNLKKSDVKTRIHLNDQIN
ncbi:hypothetical protein MA16_Dca009248 [Dendrobium catenatum]|uniref:Uncharacterized protein n=1 Tax=Dendrobium catenatum TaxID=906689 RepID=A0A2I0WYW9_9ASPA|nr:hypothetical protein MA16_Dca009248 [Dendrobium catenatum]